VNPGASNLVHSRDDVHGNGKDWDPMGSMRFPWGWEYDQPCDGNWMGIGIRRLAEWELRHGSGKNSSDCKQFCANCAQYEM